MNNLTDNQLRTSIKSLVGSEREILHKILLHFREIDRRRLFSKDGFQSLRAYAMQELKYSEDQADRRIAAMRLLKDMPEAEEKIKDGSLSLSTLAQAQWRFQRNDCSKVEKKEILAKLENATKKQTRAILTKSDNVRYSFEACEQFEKMIEELRGLHPHLSFDQLSRKVWEIAYEKLHPSKKIERAEVRKQKKLVRVPKLKPKLEDNNAQKFTSAGRVKATCAGMVEASGSGKASSIKKVSRYIPADVKRHVWKTGKRECQHCKSKFAVEYDHIVPFAKGGGNTEENLRLLCRSCNHRKGIEAFGLTKMGNFETLVSQKQKDDCVLRI